MIRDTTNQIYTRLAEYEPLTAKLASHHQEPGKPGIYPGWAAKEAVMPYVNITWQFNRGAHPAKRDAILNIDLFIQDQDPDKAEEIMEIIIARLDHQHEQDPNLARVYQNNAGELEDDPGTSHFNIEFLVPIWLDNRIS